MKTISTKCGSLLPKIDVWCAVLMFSLCAIVASGQTLEWVKQSKGAGFEEGRGMTTDENGNVFVIGTFQGTVGFGSGNNAVNLNSKGIFDVFFAKYNVVGELVWVKQVGGVGLGAGYGIAFDADGNIFITGNFNGTMDFDPGAATANRSSVGGFDIFLAKYDPSGAFLWAHNIGGTLFEESTCLGVDASGNVTIAGHFSDSVDFDPNVGMTILQATANSNLYFAQYDADGNLLWVNQIEGDGANRVLKLVIGGTGNIYLAGHFEKTADFDPSGGVEPFTAAGNFDIFFAQYDNFGKLVWANGMGSASYDEAQDIALDAFGNVYVTGRFNDTVDFDPSAGINTLSCIDFSDAFFAKYDADGALVWAKNVGGMWPDYGTGIAVDAFGQVYVVGQFIGIADFDPDAGITELTSEGDIDIYVAQYDASGNFIWAKNIGSTNMEECFDMVLDAERNIHLTGLFKETVDFDLGAGTHNMVSAGEEDMFVAKYKSATSSTHNTPSINAKIYPVPASNVLYVELPDLAVNVRITVFDQFGRVLSVQESRSEQQQRIDTGGFNDGIYYLFIETADGTKTLPFEVYR